MLDGNPLTVGEDNSTASFTTSPGFCPDCGSILPLLDDTGDGGVTCYACKRRWGPKIFGDMAFSHVVKFKDENTYASATQTAEDDDNDADGPIIDRRCPKCNNKQMSYATLQLRSADEGQTVFYTCTKCKYKESENS
ncbi:DNA-directed RNA polymerase I subunit RPA12 [Copidosoma floridanum]|uniref:DNA-directed RNA polymerase I subunit RPA12 n=1 Tax=Copidosoma floridanum TaxID=29053 RepID=UPI0006C963AB|nr:DNA-directed RNA polymerase I subunit RPA12 [Copidosoma floridanum]